MYKCQNLENYFSLFYNKILFTHWLVEVFAQKLFFGHFWDFKPGYEQCISIQKCSILQHFCPGMHRIQNLEFFGWERYLYILIFSSFLFLLFLSFLLHSLAFYWACFQFKNFCESMYAMGQFFTIEYLSLITENFAASFSLKFLSIFVHISGSRECMTLIWVSLERTPHADFGQRRWSQNWNKGQHLL